MGSRGKIAFPVILVLGAITGYMTYTYFTAAIPEENRIDSPYYQPLSPASGGNQAGNTGEAVQTAGGGNQTAGGGNQTAGGGNQTAGGGGGQSPYILGGNWNLNVQGGNVTDFTANIMMVHTDGSGYHTHNITNFNVGNATVQLVQGQETSISGSADIYTNGTIKWPGVDTTLTLTPNGTVMTIMPPAEDTDNHFQGQPIYGIASQLSGENGTMIVQATPPGQQQQQQQQQQ